MRVLLLSKYGRKGASTRLRSLQYIPFLEQDGIHVHAAPLLDDTYLTGLYAGHPPFSSILSGYARRIQKLLSSRAYDLVWIEKEALPWVPLFLELTFLKRARVVIDYDDAIFHNYDRHKSPVIRFLLAGKIERLMNRANAVVVGSDYLREHALTAGARSVVKIPTVVDLRRYGPPPVHSPSSQPIRIGWIGTPATVKYLIPLLEVFRDTAAENSARFVVIGAKLPSMPGLDAYVDHKSWSEEGEVDLIRGLDIGIMPIPDEPFERGKCGYKLIQYMACGKPVVASAVGENLRIVQHERNGLLAETLEDWRAALSTLCRDQHKRAEYGSQGRKLVEQDYSLQVTAPRLANHMKRMMGSDFMQSKELS